MISQDVKGLFARKCLPVYTKHYQKSMQLIPNTEHRMKYSVIYYFPKAVNFKLFGMDC